MPVDVAAHEVATVGCLNVPEGNVEDTADPGAASFASL